MRSPVEDHDLVPSLSHNFKGQTHSRVSECYGQPPIQVQPSAVNRMVTASTGVQTDLPEVIHSSCGPVCHSSEPQTPSLCVSNPRPKGLGHRCSEHKLVGSHCLCLPCDSSPSQGDPKNQAMPLPDHRNSPRLARDALVLDLVQLSTEIPLQLLVSMTLLKQCHKYVFHNNLQQLNLHTWCLGADNSKNKASLWRWQRELLPLSGHQQGPSTSQSGPYLSPSTIDGYRTAIVDTLGPTAHHIAHNADLHRLLSSFHRDRPKSSRNLSKWNLSVVLSELTKAPFEPMKDTDLKHLTLKTAFLLALASGKRRSEIHAWVANKVSNLSQWEKVALFPSSDFIAKNQLAREGSQSAFPVTIPALTTIVDRQFRTLCPVRAQKYYLDLTKDLRGSRSLLFISFKKGHASDIRPATLSSWLKQTILLCYKQADQQALDLFQVKAHDIRAFAASKAFTVGYWLTRSCKPVTRRLTTHLPISI